MTDTDVMSVHLSIRVQKVLQRGENTGKSNVTQLCVCMCVCESIERVERDTFFHKSV